MPAPEENAPTDITGVAVAIGQMMVGQVHMQKTIDKIDSSVDILNTTVQNHSVDIATLKTVTAQDRSDIAANKAEQDAALATHKAEQDAAMALRRTERRAWPAVGAFILAIVAIGLTVAEKLFAA